MTETLPLRWKQSVLKTAVLFFLNMWKVDPEGLPYEKDTCQSKLGDQQQIGLADSRKYSTRVKQRAGRAALFARALRDYLRQEDHHNNNNVTHVVVDLQTGTRDISLIKSF